MSIKIGADPEVFVKLGSDFVSAHGMIQGTKEKPYPVECGAVQVDGMALEFNIDPASTMDEFTHNIETVMGTLKSMVPDHRIAIQPVALFDGAYFKAQPKESKILGCDPDYNAWTGMVNEPPESDKPMRTAAGHIHIGWTEGMNPDDESAHQSASTLIRQLDFFLGLPSLLFDKDVTRREMYGKAGAYRTKPYGAEYRVLSNMWLTSKELQEWAYLNTIEAVTRLQSGDMLEKKYGDIQDLINSSNIAGAMDIIEAEKIGVPQCMTL